MRDRNKWTVQNLSAQVDFLTQSLDEKIKEVDILKAQLTALEMDNAQLRIFNDAMQRNMIDSVELRQSSPSCCSSAVHNLVATKDPWEAPPVNFPSSCIADEILQNVIDAARAKRHSKTDPPSRLSRKPNPAALLFKDLRTSDDMSNVAADIVRSYPEIETLTNKVAVFYTLAILFNVSCYGTAYSGGGYMQS